MIGKLQAPLDGNSLAGSLPGAAGIGSKLRQRWLGFTLGGLALAGAVTGGAAVARSHAATSYASAPVAQQDLTQSVTASGTVNPQNTVTVGSQASGTISAVYVDYNSRVVKGQVLARIDPSQMQAQLDQAQAQLAQAQAQAQAQVENAAGAQSGVTVSQAGIATAQASVAKAQSAYQLAEQTVSRDKSLLSQGYIAQSQYDSDQSSAVAAQSALASAQAAALQAKAQTSQSSAQAAGSQDTAQAQDAAVQAAQAQVAQDQYNLSRGVITSPVDGTVIGRNIAVGETVASSFQTPTLFTIAQDLKKMEVDISVGEPDIGNVKPGDKVNFSVLAYPNQTFNGVVSQVRVDPTTVNNVVTYDVVTLVNNPNDQLLPGMTANASIAVATAHNALVVPQAALAWRPASGGTKHRTHNATASNGSPWGQTAAGAGANTTSGSGGIVFVERNGKPVPVRVKIDLTSGTQVAVTPLRGSLQAGDDVITGDSSQSTTRTRTAQSGGPGGPSAMGSIGRAIR